MKNRKNMFALAIVALILVLGVGYAVVNSVTLTINGSTAGKTENLKVVYDGENSGTNANVTEISSPNGTTAATFTVADMVKGTPVAMEFEIENRESDVNATLALPTATNTNAEYFSVSYEYKDSAMAGASTYSAWSAGTKTLNYGAKATVKVIVSMIKTPVLPENNTATINISINATPVNNATGA